MAESSDNGMGFFMGIVLLVVVVIFFLFFGLPYLRNTTQAPQINVPGEIDVNVQQEK